jgi:hypothetical protein
MLGGHDDLFSIQRKPIVVKCLSPFKAFSAHWNGAVPQGDGVELQLYASHGCVLLGNINQNSLLQIWSVRHYRRAHSERSAADAPGLRRLPRSAVSSRATPSSVGLSGFPPTRCFLFMKRQCAGI